MFGLGKKPQPETPQPSIPVVTIPTEFYAGANPTITFKKVEKVITQGAPAPMPVADKKAFDKATASGTGQPLHPTNVFSNRKKIVLIGGGLFVLFLIGGAVYYWLNMPKQKPAPKAPAKVVAPVAPPAVSTTPVVIEPPPEQPVAPPPTDGKIEFPSTLLSKAADLDNDGLTDAEEALYKSDPGIPDSDSDGYVDGSEVFHLYNPVGKEPIKLIESGTVVDYVNPALNYAMYHPADWQVGNVSGDFRDMLFSTINGDHVEVRVFDKAVEQTFSDWLAVNAPSERFADLAQFVNRFNDQGYKRTDELVYYYVTANRVHVIVYHTTDASVVSFPGIIEMMARSFRTDASRVSIVPLPPSEPPATNETDGLPDTAPAAPEAAEASPIVL